MSLLSKKIIISGGPATGRTTIINHLEEIGYECEHEFSREIIAEGIRLKNGIVPWDNLEKFTEKLFKERENQYQRSTDKSLVFFDRSIIDSIAYMEYDNLPIPDYYKSTAKKMRYFKTVFIAPFWDDIYQQDNERRESLEKCKKLENSLIKCYEKYDYQIVMIPKVSLEDRIKFILSKLNEKS